MHLLLGVMFTEETAHLPAGPTVATFVSTEPEPEDDLVGQTLL
jgi:hypothetical protein